MGCGRGRRSFASVCRHHIRILALCQTYIERSDAVVMQGTCTTRARGIVQLGMRHCLSSVRACVCSRPYLLPCQAPRRGRGEPLSNFIPCKFIIRRLDMYLAEQAYLPLLHLPVVYSLGDTSARSRCGNKGTSQIGSRTVVPNKFSNVL